MTAATLAMCRLRVIVVWSGSTCLARGKNPVPKQRRGFVYSVIGMYCKRVICSFFGNYIYFTSSMDKYGMAKFGVLYFQMCNCMYFASMY